MTKIEVIETELAALTRTLEGMSRRSAIYRDLDRAGYLLARTLAARGPSSINGLAERLGLDATTVTRQVATMENAGFVRRRRDPHDARVSRIELSALGKRRMEGVRTGREERIARLLRPVARGGPAGVRRAPRPLQRRDPRRTRAPGHRTRVTSRGPMATGLRGFIRMG